MGMEIGEYAIEALLDTPEGRARMADFCRKCLSSDIEHMLTEDEKKILRVTLEEVSAE